MKLKITNMTKEQMNNPYGSVLDKPNNDKRPEKANPFQAAVEKQG